MTTRIDTLDDEPLASDLVVVGSGAAGLTAALTAAVAGLSVMILEKTSKVGGTSAMSGAAAWVPANHHAKAAGVEDSPAEALAYLRATAPDGWRETEDRLWQTFAAEASNMLAFVERHSPLRFALTSEPDVFVEAPGAKSWGRMTSPLPLQRRMLGPYAKHVRRSTLPHIFTYQETTQNDLFRRPFRTVLKLAPRLAGRLATRSAAKGTALITGLLRGCLDRGCRIELDARAVELITDATNRVTGLVVEQRGLLRRITAHRGVLLASGGFEWNAELLSRHFPGPVGLLGSPSGNEGDAVRLAQAVGAQLAHMDQALIYPCVPTFYEGRLQALPIPFHMEPNAIVVDRSGKRFTSEYAVDLGEALDRRDPQTGAPLHLPAWLISDADFLRPALRWYARNDPGWITRADSIAALAGDIGIDPAALVSTVDRFNQLCAKGRDEDFHRGETIYQRAKSGGRPTMQPIRKAPFVAVSFNRCVLSTKGGLRTNEHGQVLGQDGGVIPGLYCAGAAMANPIGTRAISAGTTIGPNMTWGYVSARHVLTSNRGVPADADMSG